MSTLSRSRYDRRRPPRRAAPSAEGPAPRTVPVKALRQWRYQTRPSFKRVRDPLVDVFNEAEEVLIVVDLGGFSRGEISFTMTPEHYVVQATRGEQCFREVIELPQNVDLERSRERLVNGVLEIILPRARVQKRGARQREGDRP